MVSQRQRRVRVAAWISIFGLAIGAAAVVACSAPAPTGSNDSNIDDGLAIQFPKGYSAFDGTHDFKLPAMVTGVKKVKWTTSDPDTVDLEPSADTTSVMITMRKAGSVTITAKSGSLSGTATVDITQATPDDWESGNQRYNNGVIIMRGDRDHDGGGGGGDGGGGGFGNKQAACTNCHGDTSKMDVQHTPMQTGGYTDDELITIFTQGKKPDGVPQRIMKADQWQRIHTWAMPDDAKKGVVIYLRSLEPKTQGPTIDFGGRGQHGDGGGGHGGN
jgi:hypothetical protein